MSELEPAVLAGKVRELASRPDAGEYSDAVLRSIGIDPTGGKEDVTAALATYLAARVDVEMLGRDPHEVALHGPSDAARLQIAELCTATTDLLDRSSDA